VGDPKRSRGGRGGSGVSAEDAEEVATLGPKSTRRPGSLS
jgi:hypothetical protein